MNKKTKKFIIIAAIVLVIIIAVLYLGSRRSAAPASSSGLVTTGQPVLPNGQAPTVTSGDIDQFSALLATIQSITIDTSIFQDKGYLALQDNPVDLGTDVIGRTNPFAPIGSDPVVASTNGIVAIQTIQPDKVSTTSAELGAQVTLVDTQPVSVIFEYGTTADLGTSTNPPITLTHTGTALTTITGLTPNTMYYVQAIGTKGSTTTDANVMTFTTESSSAQ